MTSPLAEHAAWLAANALRFHRRNDIRFGTEPALEPCLAVDATNDDACHFVEGHTGFHSWQKPKEA